MPTIVFASSKGGAGKTTAAIILASELSRKNTSLTLIDADPNQHTAKWAKKEGCPSNIGVVGNSTHETIIDDIDDAAAKTPFVIVDLEGTASMTVASAVSRADLVIVPFQASQDDADEAVKTIKLIKRQEKVLNRSIPFAGLVIRTNPAIVTRTLRALLSDFDAAGIDIFETSLTDREAFRSVKSFGGTVQDLDPKDVSGIEKAAKNAHDYAAEVAKKLKSNSQQERIVSHG